MSIILPPKWAIPMSLGFSVFPIVPRSKSPLLKWKDYQTTHAPPELVAFWDDATPAANVGIATGAQSGCIVVDMDNPAAIGEAYELGLPETLMARTPRGMHAFFKHPGERVSNSAQLRDGIDLRGDGGYVVAPGSHYVPTAEDAAKGKVEGWYEWINPGTPLADAPEWAYAGHQHKIVERVVTVATAYRGPTRSGADAFEAALQAIRDATIGANLNQSINDYAFEIGQLVAGGWVEAEGAWAALVEVVEEKGDNPAKDIDTMTRGWSSGMLQPKQVLPRTDPDEALGAAPPLMPSGAVMPEVPSPISVGPAVRPSIMAPSQFPDYFEGVVYINGRDEFFTPDGQFLKRSAFDGTYGGPTFMLGAAGTGPSKSPSDAFLKNESWVAPRAQGVCFRPSEPPGSIIAEEGRLLLNCYVPVPIRRVAGDPTPFLVQLEKMIPDEHDRDILLHWMASHCQNVGSKFGWWPVIQGTQGNGKTMIIKVLSYCTGNRYTHIVNPQAMIKTSNQFNAWILFKRLIAIEEVKTDDKRDLNEMLKPLVTNDDTNVEGKGTAQATGENRANGVIVGNHKDGLPIDDKERRWAIFYTAQQNQSDLARDGMSGDYFPKLWAWLRKDGYAIVYDYLMRFPLRPELDPAQLCTLAPYTSSTEQALAISLGFMEQEILEAIDEGQAGFVGGMVSSKAVSALAARLRRTIPSRKMRGIMQSLGYDWHPKLPDGRCTTPAQGAYGGKIRLYIHRDNAAALALETSAEVTEMYNALQAEGALG